MKKLLILLLLVGPATCVAQRHPFNSRPYHPPDRPVQRDARRVQPVPAPAPRPQPVNAPAPKPDKHGK